MSWKNWPGWLKGGIVGIIVVIFMLIIYILRGHGLFIEFSSELLLWIFIGLLFSFSIYLLQRINSRCWLRGGVIGIVIGTIILILSYINLNFTVALFYESPASVLWKYPLFILIFKIIPLVFSFQNYSEIFILSCGMISFLINTFIIGSIICWIYGKIKSKSKKKW